MNKGRLEAFSDGMIGIFITIMVLELKRPVGSSAAALLPLWPVFLSYILSYIYIGIYWNNHHHLFQAVHTINGRVLWANLHLLFWLSLVPLITWWMGEEHFAPVPVAVYGLILLCAGCAYFILTKTLLAIHDNTSVLAKALGRDFKGKTSLVIYAIAVLLACKRPVIACMLYALVAVMWIVPDRRIERVLSDPLR